MLLPEPQPETFVRLGHHMYNGRNYYGDHASELAELAYLRDWKVWAEQHIKTIRAFGKMVNELAAREETP